MKRINIFIILLLCSGTMSLANEGMWMPSLLGKYTLSEMNKAGFRLSKEDVYHINEASLKDAVLGMASSGSPTSFFGTASFISETGLAITNHHLGLKYIQNHSTPGRNYVRDGFVAASPEEELTAEELTLSRLVRIEDVTDRITEGFEHLSPGQQNNLLNQRGKELAKQYDEGGKYKAIIKSYFSGNQYFLEVYEQFSDVKIVAIPPLSVAKFGGNKDNWQWPRQSADFAILRVYDEVSGQPVKPLKSLAVSRQGVEEDDFTLLMGFPGSTKLFLTSEAIRQLAEVTNYHSVQARSAKIKVIEQAMKADEKIWVKYSDVHASGSNHLLRWQAEMEGIAALDLVERKKAFERAFPERLDAQQAKEFGQALQAITRIVEELDTLEQVNAYIMEAGIQGAEITSYVAMFDRLGAMATRYTDRITQRELDIEANRLRQRTTSFFEEFDFPLEKKILTTLVKLYDQNVSDYYMTKPVREGLEKYNHDHSAYIESIFAESVFTSQESILHFLDHFTQADGARLEQDPVFQLCLGFFLVNRDRVNPRRSELRKQYAEYHKEYVRLISQHADQKTFPDANRSLRLSFGKVKGYEYDGKEYQPHTNLQQLLEKHNTGDVYYQLPDDFVQLIRNTEDADQVPVCLINDSHTTGGSSGSPLLNAKGELVGIGFDRVNHGLVSDFEYFPQYSRNIAVDIRYVLFILERYMDAGPLVDEFSFARNKRKKRFMLF